jgi:RNA polymerase sigma-70 factor (sigma-E family)
VTVSDDDRETFTAWAVGRQQKLFRTAYLISGDRHRAEDLLQETLLKVAARWSRLRDEDPDAYARRVLVRDNISWWRRVRREIVVQAPPERPLPDHFDASDRRIVVASALACLTTRQRAVLVLRYYEDLTERQTATALGVSVGTVKAHAHHGLARLREAAPELAELIHVRPNQEQRHG